jgi:predicted amidohydrolase
MFLLAMVKFLRMGMPFNQVIRAVTETPARLMGLQGRIGTLRPGAYADVSIFKLVAHKALHIDIHGNNFKTDQLLLPQMTVCNGEIAFCQGDFAL